ncbi:metallophosphoesterase [Ornithinimicrobium sp. Arc0846-15]|nr:metallophosphoesterase [Ornithinimicrobium laminariae]
MRFLHTADWQIGMTRAFLSTEAQARFADARLESIRSLGNVAVAQGCEFIVVAGDVFENNQLNTQTVQRALEVMRDVAVPIYLLPGNHDSLERGTLYEQDDFVAHLPEHVHILAEPGAHEVREGVELVAAPWHGKHPDRDLVSEALSQTGPADGTTRIVVGHGSIDALDRGAGERFNIAAEPLESALAAGQIHFVALGDRHSTTSVGSSGAIWYSGASEVTALREEAPGNVLVVDLEAGQAPSVTQHHVGTWTFAERAFDVSTAADVAAVERGLSTMPSKDRTVLKLRLQGTLALSDHHDLMVSMERYEQMFAAIPDWQSRSSLAVLSSDEDLAALGLSGFVARAASEILSQTDQDQGGQDTPEPGFEVDDSELLEWTYRSDADDDSTSARDALALLYRLKKEGSR